MEGDRGAGGGPGWGPKMGSEFQLVEARCRAKKNSEMLECRRSTQNFVGFQTAIVLWALEFLLAPHSTFYKIPPRRRRPPRRLQGSRRRCPSGVPWSFPLSALIISFCCFLVPGLPNRSPTSQNGRNRDRNPTRKARPNVQLNPKAGPGEPATRGFSLFSNTNYFFFF